MRFILSFVSGVLIAASVVAAPGEWHLTLKDVETAAVQNSSRLQAAEHDWLAADNKARAQLSRLGPRLSLDASYRYVTEVPTFQAAPGAPAIQFGDNKNYSYGPAINWLIWDSGGIYNSARSLRAVAESKKEEYESQKLRTLQNARLAYFQVQLALEQMRLIADSFQLASDQHNDIARRRKAGTLSQIDDLSSHQEVLNRQREFQQAQTELSLALRELVAITGVGTDKDMTAPVDGRMAEEDVAALGESTLKVTTEGIEQTKSAFAPVDSYQWSDDHPNVLVFRELAEASRRASQSVQSGQFPIVNVSAKTTRDYPNGPVLESFNQKTFAVTASLPIFEWNRVSREAREQKELSSAHTSRARQATADLKRDWDKARDQVRGLLAQQKINRTAVEESKKLSTLVYDSYRGGGSTYLEVENANLRYLQSTVMAARTDVQILIQMAILDSLSSKNLGEK